MPIATLGVSSAVASLLTLVQCDSATNHSWVSSSLVNRLGLVGEPAELTISGCDSTTAIETQRLKFTVSFEPNNSYFVFPLCAYLKDNQDYYPTARPNRFILGDDNNSPCFVCLPIVWVVSGPPPVGSTSPYFKCVVEDSSLTNKIKSWYELDSYGSFKQGNAGSAADKLALFILSSETVQNG